MHTIADDNVSDARQFLMRVEMSEYRLHGTENGDSSVMVVLAPCKSDLRGMMDVCVKKSGRSKGAASLFKNQQQGKWTRDAL